MVRILTTKQIIGMACEKSGIKKSELARRINTTPSSFSQRLERGRFTPEEMAAMAEVLGCKFFYGFAYEDGKVIGETIE